MNNTSLILVVALSFISLLLWDAWQKDYANAPVPAADTTIKSTDTSSEPTTYDLPKTAVLDQEKPIPVVDQRQKQTITITTDVVTVEIDLQGGGIARLALSRYPIFLKEPAIPFELLGTDSERTFIEQGGIAGREAAVDHHVVYAASKQLYELGSNAESLEVPITWSNGKGIDVTKVYTFKRGSYLIGVRYMVSNHTDKLWRGRLYDQLQRTIEPSRRRLVYTFTGPAISTPEKRYEKFTFSDLEDTPIDVTTKNGWISILQHYFVAALIPPSDMEYHYYSKVLDETHYLVGLYGPVQELLPGGTTVLETTIYAGPKRQHILENTAPGLDLTVDLGVLWFIAKPLFLILEAIQKVTGNWGWAIIILTFSIKLLFYPLSAAGYRSMAKMRRVQPRLVAIKERYSKDRARLNQAMMELYKEEKINPLGGCFPILIQIPVFISLYWVLLESVELRQAPFILWIDNLSSKDPYFVLPLLMGISMWFQQKLNPAPIDPIQQKVMQLLPFIFTVFFAFFPSGLVLYWVVNNILSITQQWNITRTIEKASGGT